MTHRKKNDLQRLDSLILNLSLSLSVSVRLSVSLSFLIIIFIGYLLRSCSAQLFIVVLFSLAFYTVPFSSKRFFWGLFLSTLSILLFVLVVKLILVPSMSPFSDQLVFLEVFFNRAVHLNHCVGLTLPRVPSTDLSILITVLV